MLTLLHTSQTEEDNTSIRMRCSKKCYIIEQLALQSHLDFLFLAACLAFPLRVVTGDLNCFMYNRIIPTKSQKKKKK